MAMPPTGLSPQAEAAIRLLPGNDRCADCSALFPQWADVSFGVLVCLACAGRHRALGVQLSVVKSIEMDRWTLPEQRALESGGNAKWTAVCVGTAMADRPLALKYQSSIGREYKARVAAAAASPDEKVEPVKVTEFLAGLTRSPEKQQLRSAITSMPSAETSPTGVEEADDVAESDELRVKCTTCQAVLAIDKLDSHSKRCVLSSSNSAPAWHVYESLLGIPGGPLGFTLTKTSDGSAEVSRITPNSEAERSRVVLSSLVVGVNDLKTTKYDEIVALVHSLPRPIRFTFAYRDDSSSSFDGHRTSVSSVVEPIAVATEIEFEETTLGCTLQAQGQWCVVTEVDTGG
ncbi:hypothetical protein ATCC90586_006321 [Pythium insidiosum]|nr:hypothetical protein ATCC90586_006321 [Pythium insidiosum]